MYRLAARHAKVPWMRTRKWRPSHAPEPVLHRPAAGFEAPDMPFLSKLRARIQRALQPLPRQNGMRLVVLGRGTRTITTFMIAAFQKNWDLRFALSAGDALALLRQAPQAALVCDWDSQPGDWRELCGACVRQGMPFHLIADMPPDDVFLAVAAAGGSSVLWKPFNADQVIAAMETTPTARR